MTPHVHHWDSMMIFEENSKSLFTSDLFIQPGFNKPVISEDLSDSMIALYQGVGIFASEKPVRMTSKRLEKLQPKMIYPMHGSCIDGSVFSKYVDSIMRNDFAYSGKLLGRSMEYEITWISGGVILLHHWLPISRIGGISYLECGNLIRFPTGICFKGNIKDLIMILIIVR